MTPFACDQILHFSLYLPLYLRGCCRAARLTVACEGLRWDLCFTQTTGLVAVVLYYTQAGPCVLSAHSLHGCGPAGLIWLVKEGVLEYLGDHAVYLLRGHLAPVLGDLGQVAQVLLLALRHHEEAAQPAGVRDVALHLLKLFNQILHLKTKNKERDTERERETERETERGRERETERERVSP